MQVTGSIRIPFVVNGVDGKNGNDGVGIASVTEEYALHTSGTTAPTDGWSDTISNPTKLQPYLWNRETTTYTDGATRYVPAHVVAMYSADGRGIKDITNYYLASDQSAGITNETEGFTTDVQEITPELPYLWNYEEVTYDDDTSYRTDACIIGVYGKNGEKGDKGADGYTVEVNSQNIFFTEGVTSIQATVQVRRGDEYVDVPYQQTTIDYGDISKDYLNVTVENEDGGSKTLYVTFNDIRTGSNTQFRITGKVTIGGVAGFDVPFFVGTILDGEKGDKGDKGDTGDTGATGATGSSGSNAVYYHVESTANNATYYPARGAFSPEGVTFTLYQTNGSETKELACYWYVTYVKEDGETTTAGWYSNSATASITVPFDQGGFLASSVRVQACSTYNNTGSQYDGCERTVTVTASCAVRYQNWDDVADGFDFQDGSLGSMYIDFVYYGGSYYQCKKRHDKVSGTTDPTSGDAQDQYWTGVNKFTNVATNLLLAETAKIENLYVDDVYMESSGDETKKTALWISPEHDGMKIMKMDDDFVRGRENTESNNWSNPTTWFHGGSIPSIGEVYDPNETGDEVTIELTATSYTNTSGDDYTGSGMMVLGVNSVATSVGSPTILNIPEMLTASVTDGVFTDREGTRLQGSEVRFEVRLATTQARLTTTNGYTLLRSFSVSNNSGGTTTSTMQKITYTFTPTSATTYVGIYRTYRAIRSGGSCSSEAGSGKMTVNAVVSGYVSQFGANGVFIGYKSDSYFRLALDGNSVQHTLLAGGYGLDVTENGVLQYSGGTGNKMPVGGTLLLGFFTVGGSVKGSVWTFDGNAPTVSYYSAGYWTFYTPQGWGNILGLSSASNYCVTVTPRHSGTEVYTAKVAGYTMDSNRLYVDIVTHCDGVMTDCDVFVRVDYIGIGGSGAQTLSVSSEDTKSAQAEELNVEQEKETED